MAATLASARRKLVAEASNNRARSRLPADHDMVGAGDAMLGQDFAGERAEAALHAVADDRAADLLGDGEADAHGRIAVIARSRTSRTKPGMAARRAGVGGQEIGALARS